MPQDKGYGYEVPSLTTTKNVFSGPGSVSFHDLWPLRFLTVISIAQNDYGSMTALSFVSSKSKVNERLRSAWLSPITHAMSQTTHYRC